MVAVGLGVIVLTVLGVLTAFGLADVHISFAGWIALAVLGGFPAYILVAATVEFIYQHSTKERRERARRQRDMEKLL